MSNITFVALLSYCYVRFYLISLRFQYNTYAIFNFIYVPHFDPRSNCRYEQPLQVNVWSTPHCRSQYSSVCGSGQSCAIASRFPTCITKILTSRNVQVTNSVPVCVCSLLILFSRRIFTITVSMMMDFFLIGRYNCTTKKMFRKLFFAIRWKSGIKLGWF